jgi:probable rRNA maturation factor
MEVLFENPFGKEYDWLEGRYNALAKVAFQMLKIKINYEVDVSLVGDKEIQDINRNYRHIDRITDVISFAFNDDKTPGIRSTIPRSNECWARS